MKLLEAIKALTELEATTKRTEKEQILRRYVDNDTLTEIFYYAYSPFLRYHLKKFDESAVKTVNLTKPVSDESFEEFKKVLKLLNERTLTGNEAHAAVFSTFSQMNALEIAVFSRILRQDLDVGVTAKTFNTVHNAAKKKKPIPVFECMLAKDSAKINLKKQKFSEVIIEPKLDGYRVIAQVFPDGEVKLLTRNGKPYSGYNLIEDELSQLPTGAYDGEIVGLSNTFADVQSQAFKHKEGKSGVLHIFDFVPLETFSTGVDSTPLLERKERLKKAFQLNENPDDKFKYLRLVPYSEVVDLFGTEIDETYDKFLSQGFEGLMLKNPQSPYSCTRSANWLKKVPFISLDLKIIGFAPGDVNSKYKDTLGALVVEYKGNEVNVSGISDSMRDEIWSNQDRYLGAIAEIHAREPSKNKDQKESLRFPRFKRWRLDKE